MSWKICKVGVGCHGHPPLQNSFIQNMIHMRKEITVDIDPHLLKKIEKSSFELEDLIDLAEFLTIGMDSTNEFNEIYIKNLQKLKEAKLSLLNKYKDINEPIILLDIWKGVSDPNFIIVEESKCSGHFNDINLLLQ